MMKPNTLALTTLAAVGAAQQATAQMQGRPNVVIVIADDMGYGDVSAYGSNTIRTPNIDRLANEGVCFTDGHATSATSTPSRYGLFTGMYPWKNENAKILPGDAPLIIGTEQFTMPKMFQHAGYETAAIGKWHLGMGVGKIDWNKTISPSGNAVGFDYTCLIAATVDRVPTVYVENGRVVGLKADDPLYVDYENNFEGEPTALTNPELVKTQWSHGHHDTVVNGIPRIGFMKGGKSAYWKDDEMAQYFLNRVDSFINASRSKPFFLYYGLHEPHVPRTPATQFAGSTRLGPRGDVLAEADWCVGQLMKKLEEAGVAENTIVIFSSDNGPVLDDGYDDGARATAAMHDPNGGLRGGKYSLYDAGTRVPMFVYWKGHTHHVVNNSLVSQQDLLASFAQMLGQPTPSTLDSEGMMDTFLGKNKRGRKDMIVEASGRLAYRYGQYALIPPYKGKKTNETDIELGNEDDWTLYNLGADKAQQKDVSKARPQLLKKLKKRFLKKVGTYYNPDTAAEVLK